MTKITVFLLAVLFSVHATALDLPLVKFVGGLEPERLSGNELRIRPGFTTDASGNRLARFSLTVVDMGQRGCNGIDHSGGPQNGKSYQLYTVYNNDTDDACFILSQSITYSGVDYPTGYSAHKKLRFSFVYRTDWGGIPAFHLSYWPGSPEIRLTDAQDGAPYRVAHSLETGGDWQGISFLSVMPDAARIALIGLWVEADTTAGTCYIRTYSQQNSGIPVGSVTPSNAVRVSGMWKLRVTSTHMVEVRTIGGCRFRSIYLLGYDMTEPS